MSAPQFIQFCQARCLLEEAGSAALPLPDACQWPEGFTAMIGQARAGAVRSRELESLASMGGDNPHLNYPMRYIVDQTLALKHYGFSEALGTITIGQAIREAYPGGTYHHFHRAHKVAEWRINGYERTIYLKPVKAAQQTHPLIKNSVHGSFASEEVIDARLLRTTSGALAETRLYVFQSVEGLRTEKGALTYSFLRQTNPRMRRQQREFSTTGLLLQFGDPWFAGKRREDVDRRKTLALALTELFCRTHSIARQEIDFSPKDIAIRSPAGTQQLEDGLAIYDNIHGGLRLTSKLYDELPELSERLARSARALGEQAMVDPETAERFVSWVAALQPALLAHFGPIEVPEGQMLIYAPGSTVQFRKNGMAIEARLGHPDLIEIAGEKLLMYQYEAEPGAKCWVAHDSVEASGSEWARTLWNPVRKEFS